eukprot:TRINITY_DN59534_c0_g1_i1.p1 TRINITY_DN59534_c0_g1~~TRINITY_DN59534_c0_g1_i1.p1  ORF type:complete len:159 (-),score=16.16 TRINITY_DN59534_c0_g1_i1:33-479(-)
MHILSLCYFLVSLSDGQGYKYRASLSGLSSKIAVAMNATSAADANVIRERSWEILKDAKAKESHVDPAVSPRTPSSQERAKSLADVSAGSSKHDMRAYEFLQRLEDDPHHKMIMSIVFRVTFGCIGLFGILLLCSCLFPQTRAFWFAH